MKPPKTRPIFLKARGTTTMSMSSSCWSAEMKRAGMPRTKPSRPCERALEPRPRARDRLCLLDVLPDFLLPDQLHEAADQGVGGARHALAGDRVLAEDGLEEVPAARALRELGQRPQDRVLDEADDPGDQTGREVDEPADRLAEDALRAVPHAAEVEDVAPAQRVEEAVDRLTDDAAGHPERLDLLLDPTADLLEDAVVVERLGDAGSRRGGTRRRARMMFAALRSTRDMFTGLTPRMIVNIRKPGIALALSAK